MFACLLMLDKYCTVGLLERLCWRQLLEIQCLEIAQFQNKELKEAKMHRGIAEWAMLQSNSGHCAQPIYTEHGHLIHYAKILTRLVWVETQISSYVTLHYPDVHTCEWFCTIVWYVITSMSLSCKHSMTTLIFLRLSFDIPETHVHLRCLPGYSQSPGRTFTFTLTRVKVEGQWCLLGRLAVGTVSDLN